MSSLPTNLWMLCPDCGREICEIVSIFLSFNSTPMVKLRCKCTPYQVTNITLKDYIKSLNNAPFNNIHCISHPQIQECTDFCVECKHWLCSQCVKTHERGHIKYHSDSTISGYCLLHNSKLKFHCEICDIDLCELCDHNKEHQLVNLKELYEETYKSIGFKNNEEKEMFLKLISVSGIGPKVALSILSGIRLSDLSIAIKTEDIKVLSTIKGLGKKTAERIVLELKDKISVIGFNEENVPMLNESAIDEATEALVALGINKNEAYRLARENARENDKAEEIITRAFQNLN